MIIGLTIKSKKNVLLTQLWSDIDFKNFKLAKMANFSIESGFVSGSSFVAPLQERECFKNINFNKNILKTHCLVKFERV